MTVAHISDAAIAFDVARYNPEKGAQSFLNELFRRAKAMVDKPDIYTIKR